MGDTIGIERDNARRGGGQRGIVEIAESLIRQQGKPAIHSHIGIGIAELKIQSFDAIFTGGLDEI